MNPVDNASHTRPLIKALRGHVDAVTASMAGSGPMHGQHGRLEAVRPAAVAWVYYSVLVAWAEDHQLVNPWLRDVTPKLRSAVLNRPGGALGWLSAAINSLAAHPATQCLLDPRYSQLRDHTPSDEACRDLIEWWSSDAPSLAYQVEDGPTSISGWLPGDLLQALSAERVKTFAFAQTPWWIADGILDLTLVPAAGEFRGELLRTIDPTCGTGHMLTRTIDYLWEWYTTGALACRQMKKEGVSGGPVLEPAEAIRRILAGVDGCEIDPLTAAVARLRVVVAVGDLMHRSGLLPVLRLDTIPRFHPRVVVGDSLLAGVATEQEYAQVHPALADVHNLGLPAEKPAPAPVSPRPRTVVTAQLDLFGEVAHA
ncbi:hypothetical protein OIE13_22655 [Streptosporangium sp. NBC_01810]|uniref:hypothetical protein n=1 Tax=Streptosporangium sp. NBC_01810 TaxID=2975951 RepID=UPI002DD966AD|nr:hypothetical protein [Streptosporangium sp. NBC_01810]WSA23746.1 hypothetical protein OIE13_22655 [Streptosporangium sp. NBC_01810]